VLKGELTYKSQKTDIGDYYGESTDNKNQPSSETTKSSIPPLQFSLNVDIGKLFYENYNIRDFEFNGAIDPDALRITNMAGFLDESDFEVAGTIEKPMEYMNGNQDLKGDLYLRSAFFDFNPFLMSSEVGEGQENEEELKPFFIPENLDLTLDATAGTLHYEEYIINNAKAKIKVANQKAIIDEISGKSFGGQIKMTGVYDTYKKEQPLMDVHVDLKRLNIEQAFKEIETLQKIAPIGKLLDGTFNSSFDLKSSLGNDLMPVWSSFSSKGLFEALLAKLTESDLTNKIANISGVEAFHNLNLNNTILNFEIQNGKVTCKPTKFKAAKMDMVFSGTHAIDQAIDYKLNVLVPKSMIKNKGVDAGLDLFKEQASKLGIPLNEAKDLNFDVLFTGDIKDPDVKIKLKGLEKETIKETVIETTKEVVTEKVDEVLKEQTGKDKEELEAELKARIEKIRKEARASAEKIRAAGRSGESKAKEEADKIFKQAVDEAAKQGPLAEKLATVAAEKAREKAYAEASKITKEADKRAEKVLDDAEARIDKLMKGK
jgi:hypothetical protein